jgi:hypothetical protein
MGSQTDAGGGGEMTYYDGALLSYGAGVNTVAMTLRLLDEGWRGPIVFADTGGEHPETYCHMAWMEENIIQPAGATLERVSFATLTEAEREQARKNAAIGVGRLAQMTTLEGYCLARYILPLLAVRWCSVMFKWAVLHAWADSRVIPVHLIGIAADEAQRVRDDPALAYPLVDWGWTRRDCMEYIKSKGVPIPRKSGCFFCPAQRQSDWKELLDVHPDLYARAEAMEANATRNGHVATLDPTGKVSLSHLRQAFDAQGDGMFSDDEIPREYEPCICHI